MAFQIVPAPHPAAQEVGMWDNTQQMIKFNASPGGSQTTSLSGYERSPAHSVSLNTQNVRGDTALHVAAQKGQAEAFEYLLTVGVDAEVRNDAGKLATDIMTPMKLQAALLCVPCSYASLLPQDRCH
jgi:ankyrin repeat protein